MLTLEIHWEGVISLLRIFGEHSFQEVSLALGCRQCLLLAFNDADFFVEGSWVSFLHKMYGEAQLVGREFNLLYLESWDQLRLRYSL